MNYFIFGLQRSGTNFLEQIMTRNFGANKQNRNNACWKHNIDPPEGWQSQRPTFIIYKNPYTWIESICFRNTVDWIKRQKKYPANEGPDELRLGPQHINIKNLALTYKHFHDSWIPKNEDNKNIMVIRYEDLLIEKERTKILTKINTDFYQKRKSNQWIVPQKGTVSQSGDYNEERENYYLNMQPNELNEYHISVITEVLGEDLITSLRYDVL